MLISFCLMLCLLLINTQFITIFDFLLVHLLPFITFSLLPFTRLPFTSNLLPCITDFLYGNQWVFITI